MLAGIAILTLGHRLPIRTGSGGAALAVDQLGRSSGDSPLARGLDWIHYLRLRNRQLRQDLGALIILLLWFYLTAYVVLAGAELNAEIERRRTSAEPVRQ
jgi:hypothetical protein